MAKNNARIIDEELWKQSGIDRKTGLPLKMLNSIDVSLLSGTRMLLRIKDEQQAVNRYKWDIPSGLKLTSEEIERFLYYKGQLCFFRMKKPNSTDYNYYLTPYALEGTINLYGQFNSVKPVPFASGMDKKDENKKPAYDPIALALSLLTLTVVRKNDDIPEDLDNCCVLLHDYTKQYSEYIIPRQQLQEPLLEIMSLTVPYLRTNMLASVGVKGIRVGDADQYKQVIEGSQSLDNYAKNGKIWYPILGSIEAQELTEKNMAAMNDYMQTFQSLDNLRLSLYGLANGGVFEKKAHTLGKEEEINQTNTDLVYDDGLSIRKEFCDLVNKIWNIGISVKENKQDLQSNPEMETDEKGGQQNGTNTEIQ